MFPFHAVFTEEVLVSMKSCPLYHEVMSTVPPTNFSAFVVVVVSGTIRTSCTDSLEGEDRNECVVWGWQFWGSNLRGQL